MIFFFWIHNYDNAKIGSLQQPISIKIKPANCILIKKGALTTYKLSFIISRPLKYWIWYYIIGKSRKPHISFLQDSWKPKRYDLI